MDYQTFHLIPSAVLFDCLIVQLFSIPRYQSSGFAVGDRSASLPHPVRLVSPDDVLRGDDKPRIKELIIQTLSLRYSPSSQIRSLRRKLLLRYCSDETLQGYISWVASWLQLTFLILSFTQIITSNQKASIPSDLEVPLSHFCTQSHPQNNNGNYYTNHDSTSTIDTLPRIHLCPQRSRHRQAPILHSSSGWLKTF